MINIIEAEALLNDELSDDEVDMLLAARQGVALYDVPDKMVESLLGHNLIDIIPFDNPRAYNAIKGVVPSEDGVKVLNVLDNRKWADAYNSISDTPAGTAAITDAEEHAQSLTKDVADQSGEIPADDVRNIDPDATGDRQADQQQQFATGDADAEAPETEGKVVTKKTKRPAQNGPSVSKDD